MLQLVWKRKIGVGVIDCDFNPQQDTIAAVDCGGRLALLDLHGAVIASCNRSLPLWGVSHHYDENGRLLVAVAEAQKQPSGGAATILADLDTELIRHVQGAPVWDALIDPRTATALFTTWSGEVLLVPLADPAKVEALALTGSCFGLYRGEDGSILVNCSGRGVYRLNVATRKAELLWRNESVAYNLGGSGPDDLLVSGSNEGVAYARRGQRRDSFRMAGASVTAVCAVSSRLFVGDLDGELRVFSIDQSARPLWTTRLGGGVWRIEHAPTQELLFVACGDGHLYCFRLDRPDGKSSAREDTRLLAEDKTVMEPQNRQNVVPLPFDAYHGEDPFVFISYAHKDAAQVYPEMARLNQLGHRIWYDEGISPGSEWPEDVGAALAKAALFLVFLSPQALASKHVRNEIHMALAKQKPFLAVYLEETELSAGLELQIGSLQAIPKYRLDEDRYRRLLNVALAQRLRSPD